LKIDSLRNLTVQEIEVLSELPRHTSLRAFARSKAFDPTTLVKMIARLELMLSQKIISRSSQGYSLTSAGQNIADICLRSLGELAQLETTSGRQARKAERKLLTIGARGFLNVAMCSQILMACKAHDPLSRLRILDVSPEEMIQLSQKAIIDMALHFESHEWTTMWETHRIGEVSFGAYASSDHPLHRMDAVSAADLETYSWIYPCHWDGEVIRSSDDNLPYKGIQRLRGHEAQNVYEVLELLKQSQDLSFLPDFVCAKDVLERKVQRLKIPTETPQVSLPLYLTIRTDRMSQKLVNSILRQLRSRLMPTPEPISTRQGALVEL
jgi:DNA-binding transcriptional LysR family regulator